MIAVDTNVLIRLLVKDDAAQNRIAEELFHTASIFIGITVWLESFWVLRKVYRIPVPDILAQFRKLIAMPNVQTENFELVALALSYTDRKIDLDDALHLATAHRALGFATFDEDLIKRAKPLCKGVAKPNQFFSRTAVKK